MDIVERLRSGNAGIDSTYPKIMKEAADEIERLREQCEFEKKCRNDAFEELKKQDAEIERLREENDYFRKLIQASQLDALDKAFARSALQQNGSE